MCHSPSQTQRPPVDRQSLTYHGKCAKHGKPVASPPNRESNPQGKPTEQRVQEEGASEGFSAMEEIRIETASDAKAG
ncbi:hypothetical protein KSC_003410 [Ktedonobacter sp. SOSP1-52]|nr:hypothetical protein KSC_003410 [Ktedonobacter sp. SOSP1-52]